ncbi:hypothetical protein PRIC2_009103 [Phytophthora ramorum]
MSFLRAIFLLGDHHHDPECSDSSPSRYLEEAATDYHTALLDAVNKERVARGISKLCKNRKLQSAAEIHSNDMAKRNFLSHGGSDGSTITSRISAAGFHWTASAENVAAGQSSVSSVMSSWMKSSPHRANLLNKQYTHFGCGYAYSSSSKYKRYWTQVFASGTREVCG